MKTKAALPLGFAFYCTGFGRRRYPRLRSVAYDRQNYIGMYVQDPEGVLAPHGELRSAMGAV